MTLSRRDRAWRRAGSPVLATAVAALAFACSSSRSVDAPNRRTEEQIERVAAPALPPRPAASVPARGATTALAPPALLVGSESLRSSARPLSELARRAGAQDVRRDILYLLDDLRFGPGEPVLDARSRSALDLLVARLQREPLGYVIEIQGHTDASGDEADNLRLGLVRAEAVRAYLVRAGGLPLEWTAVVSLGSGRPVAPDVTAEGRARNRRAVVLVLR